MKCAMEEAAKLLSRHDGCDSTAALKETTVTFRNNEKTIDSISFRHAKRRQRVVVKVAALRRT